MKIASWNDNSRDGKLVVVNRTLERAVEVPDIATTMQYALDNWHRIKPLLEQVYTQLNSDQTESSRSFLFDCNHVLAPLPRAFQWLDGSAYINHIELARKARGAEMPQNFWTDPLMYQGGSDTLLGARSPITMADEKWGIDFEAEIAVITDDVPQGVSIKQASSHIQLLTLLNDISLRNLIPNELLKGFGFLHGKPSSAFSPVAITPDELGDAWQNNKVHLPIYIYHNDSLFGKPNAGIDMVFDFAQLIHHAAKTRRLIAGTIIGSGTISNKDKSKGSACIVEKRMLEIIKYGNPITPYLQRGDMVTIDMLDAAENSLCGKIIQQVM